MCEAPYVQQKQASPSRGTPIQWIAALLMWPLIISWPLYLHSRYADYFPSSWYATDKPRPLGLILGILAVVWGQIFVVGYQWARWKGSKMFGPLVPVQPNETRTYEFSEGLATHLSQPEGFVLLGLYLALTWLFGLMPSSYYRFEGGVEFGKVAACLLAQDFFQYGMHRLEHGVSSAFYRASHKPHHRFTNPRLFDAFNGSVADTVLMILVPLYATACCVHCNVWSYMTFGSLYANWLVLIHSEYHHLWDPIFSSLKFGTAADHHVHHKLFVKNYGHLFMYSDILFGTYKHPDTVRVFQLRTAASKE